MYRILHATHHRTGDKWCIYPTYDWTHGQSDSIEGITHSICTLEFENHRPLYDWYVEQLGLYHPQQIEFARLNITYTVMSKRRLLELVKEKHVQGWDDPRMPTICGLRRRGYTPEAHPQLLQADRRVEGRERGRFRAAGAQRPRGPQQAVAAGDGRAAAVAGGDRKLPRGSDRRTWKRSTIRKTPPPARGKCPSPGCCTSSATTSAKTRRRSSSGWPRAAKCGSAGGSSSNATRP